VVPIASTKWHPLRTSDLWILGRHLHLASQLELTGIFVFWASRRPFRKERCEKGYHSLAENLLKFDGFKPYSWGELMKAKALKKL